MKNVIICLTLLCACRPNVKPLLLASIGLPRHIHDKGDVKHQSSWSCNVLNIDLCVHTKCDVIIHVYIPAILTSVPFILESLYYVLFKTINLLFLNIIFYRMQFKSQGMVIYVIKLYKLAVMWLHKLAAKLCALNGSWNYTLHGWTGPVIRGNNCNVCEAHKAN